jgi:hypothetical protein
MARTRDDDPALLPRSDNAPKAAAPQTEAAAKPAARVSEKKVSAEIATKVGSHRARAKSATPEEAFTGATATSPYAAHSTRGAPVDWAVQDWNALNKRLFLVTIWRLRRLRCTVPRQAEAEDLVNDAITKTIAGVRIWNPENCTLYQHLVGVIFSDISHAADSSENHLTVYNHDRPNGSTTWPPDSADEAPNQEHATLWHSELLQLLEHLHSVDPKVGRMAELMLRYDVKETEDLCRLLKLEPSEVANLRKRVKRAARTYHAETRS